MIGYLNGEILENADGKILLGIGEKSKGRVGYVVSVPQSGDFSGLNVGQWIELYIYTHVREDAFDLYGFHSLADKELFLVLLNVNGIGPKSALGILSAVTSDSLIEAIIQEDQGFLVKIPGIGKKTAERMVVELKDSMRKKMESGKLVLKFKSKEKNAGADSLKSEWGMDMQKEIQILNDAKAALVGLGYRENEMSPLLKQVLENTQPRVSRAEDLIKMALRHLA